MSSEQGGSNLWVLQAIKCNAVEQFERGLCSPALPVVPAGVDSAPRILSPPILIGMKFCFEKMIDILKSLREMTPAFGAEPDKVVLR